MSDPTLTCPNCSHSIRLTESLAAPFVAQREAELRARYQQQSRELEGRLTELRAREAAITEAERVLDQRVQERLAAERRALAAEEQRKAREALGSEVAAKQKVVEELLALLKAREEKLADAQKVQAELVRKQRELDEKSRELDLTIEKRVSEQAAQLHSKARQEVEAVLTLKISEKDLVIQRMQQQLEEMKRKAEQGSQQLQGEVQELQLEALLTSRFARDAIVPVPKGEFGGDILQHVMGPGNTQCGTILWESKRTRNWSDAWLPKLRQDQRAARAEFAVLVSQTLPKHVQHFDLIGHVYVVSPACVVPVAMMLRQCLIELSMARQASEGRETKMQMVYEYLTGPRCRQRIHAIVEAFTAMQEDLNAEKKALMKQWAKRESQIEHVIGSTAGLWGDLQGIAGKSLQEIEGLSVSGLIDTTHPSLESSGSLLTQ